MTIYDVLCYSKEDCQLSWEFVNMKNLSSIQGGSVTVGGNLFQRTEKYFDRYGCGKCQCGVPCESGIPYKKSIEKAVNQSVSAV